MNIVTSSIFVGAGATAVIDLWAIARRPLLGIPPPDYGLVGRWLAHMTRGRFRHNSIAAAPFLVMQPGMGAGIAARRTPRPAAARVQSLVTHAIFGLGLY
ncbi:MAG: DUF2938 family protein, partial [Pseudomonadota bacterium]